MNLLSNLVVAVSLALGAILISVHFHDWKIAVGIYLIVVSAVLINKLVQ